MKFPRNARIFRGHLDATPFAGVVFCLLIFVLLASLVYTPGVRIQLPASISTLPGGMNGISGLPGVDGRAVVVGLAASGELYFQNQIILETNLQQRLKIEVGSQTEPLTLVVQADRDVTQKQMHHLRDLAASAGIRQILEQVLPRAFDADPDFKKSP